MSAPLPGPSMSVSVYPLRFALLLAGVLLALASEASAAGFLVQVPGGQGPAPRERRWQLESEQVEAIFSEPFARITAMQVFRNESSAPLNVRYVFPAPHGATVSGLALFERGRSVSVRALKAEEGRELITSLLRTRREPALIAYLGRPMYEAVLEPLPAESTTTLTLKYEQKLPTDAGVSEWIHEVTGAFAGPPEGVGFALHLELKTGTHLGPVYAPSYDVRIRRSFSGTATTLKTRLRVDDPPIALYWSTSGNSVGATLLTHWPEGEKQGYFLFLAEPAHRAAIGRVIRPKTIHFAIDASGSMSGEKLAQVKAALKQAIATLNPKDRFNVVAFNNAVVSLWERPQVFAPEAMRQAFAFIDRLRTAGGTNMEAALATVLGAGAHESGTPAMVVFLTDGRPTLGEVDADKLVSSVAGRHTRIFSLGVGVDVNSVLLDRLALETRGVPEYVQPREDVERKVASLYQKIRFPVLSDIAFDFANMGASQVLPERPADLYRGSRVVLAGRYDKPGQVELVLRGRVGSFTREYRYILKAASAGQGVSNDFPARVWATRRIAALIDSIRLYKEQDPALVAEIARLSRRFGVVTEYTLYLTGEPHEAAAPGTPQEKTGRSLRAQTPHSVGNMAWAQSKSQTLRRSATRVPRRERELYLAGSNDRDVQTLELEDESGAWPRVIANRTFFFREDRGWVDVGVSNASRIDERIVRWSARFFDLLGRTTPAENARLAQRGDVLLRVDNRTLHVVDDR